MLKEDAPALRHPPGPVDLPKAVAEAASGLSRRLEYLTWQERPGVIDAFLWNEARLRLSSDEVTAVVNRQAHGGSGHAGIAGYAAFCQAVLTRTLAHLAEPVRIASEGAALAHYVSLLPGHREAAITWIGEGHHAGLGRHLARWPGHAFLLLTLCPSDSAESFLARDSFFAAMLGRV